MEDRDLFDLIQRMPNEFADYLPYSGAESESFAHTVKSCLDFFATHDAYDLSEYMQGWPIAELVKLLYEKMLNYCNWFKPMASGYNWASMDDLILYTNCGNLYCYLLRWREIIAYNMPSIVKTTTGSTEEAKQTSTTEDETQTDSEPNDTAASTARKGRPESKTFEEMLVGTDEQKLRTRKRLHELMNGKSGRNAMLFINAAIKEGLLMSTVTPKALITEFEGIGNESNCRKYKHIEPYAEAEIEAAIKRLTQD